MGAITAQTNLYHDYYNSSIARCCLLLAMRVPTRTHTALHRQSRKFVKWHRCT